MAKYRNSTGRTHLFLNFRKLDPSPRNMAPAVSSRSTTDKNIKTMVISAQITAATSMLEIVGNLAISVTETFIAKFIGYGTLIQSILLYFIFLPYVFFMNTDKNRKMVIEDGWMNLFKHVICNTALGIPVAGTTNKVAPSSEKNQNTVTGCERNIKIFTIAENNIKYSIPIRKAEYEPTINIDMHILEPSSSAGKVEAKSEDTIHDSSRKWDKVRREIINNLLENLKDETSYIETLKDLITFEDSLKQGEDFAKHFIEEHEKRKLEAQTHKIREDFKTEQLKRSIMIQLECYDDDDVARDESKAFSMFSGDIKDRIRLRKEAITRLLRHSTDDEDLYKECFEIFIDMEENFII